MIWIDWIKDIVSTQFFQTLALTFITSITIKYSSDRGRLVWAVPHQHTYLMPKIGEPGTFLVQTQEIWINNTKSKEIYDIEIIFNWRPSHFEIWEPRAYEEKPHPDGRFSIFIPNFPKKDFMTLSILVTSGNMPSIIAIRSRDGAARKVNMAPLRVFPKWFNITVTILMVIGLISVIYGLVGLISLLMASGPPSPSTST